MEKGRTRRRKASSFGPEFESTTTAKRCSKYMKSSAADLKAETNKQKRRDKKK
jgi:hypothetical protein